MSYKFNDKSDGIIQSDNSQNKRERRLVFTDEARKTKPYDINRMNGKPSDNDNNNEQE